VRDGKKIVLVDPDQKRLLTIANQDAAMERVGDYVEIGGNVDEQARTLRIDSLKLLEKGPAMCDVPPNEYALVLAALEGNRNSSREPALAATGGHLMKRIHRLLHRSQSISALAPLLAVAILLATGAVSLAALRLDPSKQVSTATQVPVSTSAKSAYSEWIDQDVVYIIRRR
jgi:hypothetical protein